MRGIRVSNGYLFYHNTQYMSRVFIVKFCYNLYLNSLDLLSALWYYEGVKGKAKYVRLQRLQAI